MEKTIKNDIKKYLKFFFFYTVIYSSALCSGLVLGDCVTKLKYKKNNLIYQEDDKITELSDLYLDLTDRRILLLSNNAKKSIDKISQCTLKNIDHSYVDSLKTDPIEILSIYGEFQEIKNLDLPWHRFNTYYNSSDNTIDWEGLSLQIYENGRKRAEDFPMVRPFTLEETKEQLHKVDTMVDQVKQDFPCYDVESLACTLEAYSFLEKPLILHYAETDLCGIDYSNIVKIDGYSPKQLDWIVDHEICHALQMPCIEEEKLERYRKYQSYFLKEIYAELYSSDVSKKDQSSKFIYDEVLDCLQLALGLSDDYRIDGFLADEFYKDPISLIKRFPVYGDEDQFFLENIQMLQSLDVVLGKKSNLAVFNNPEKGNSVLKNEVMVHLSKIFYNNLIIMNETHFSDMSLEDNFYFMYLFRQYMDNMELAIRNSEEMSFEDICRVDAICKERTILFDYLSSKYEVPKENVMMQYAYFDSEQLEYYELPSFMSNEKKEYYQALINERNRSIYDPHNIPLQKGNVYDFSYNSLTKSKK